MARKRFVATELRVHRALDPEPELWLWFSRANRIVTERILQGDARRSNGDGLAGMHLVVWLSEEDASFVAGEQGPLGKVWARRLAAAVAVFERSGLDPRRLPRLLSRRASGSANVRALLHVLIWPFYFADSEWRSLPAAIPFESLKPLKSHVARATWREVRTVLGVPSEPGSKQIEPEGNGSEAPPLRGERPKGVKSGADEEEELGAKQALAPLRKRA